MEAAAVAQQVQRLLDGTVEAALIGSVVDGPVLPQESQAFCPHIFTGASFRVLPWIINCGFSVESDPKTKECLVGESEKTAVEP